MSRSLNKVILIGNVGKKPEIKHTPSGIPVATFRLATSETWRDKTGNIKEHTDWHTVIAWRGLAEVIKKLVGKGTRIYIEGKLTTRTFDDKTGVRKRVTEIIAENMLLIDSKREKDEFDNSSTGEYSRSEEYATDELAYSDDDFNFEEAPDNSKSDIPF